MPEDPPSTPAPPAPPPGTPFNIAEEFGTRRKNLPPTRIVLIGVGLVVIVAVIFAAIQRPQSQASGSIDDVVAAEIPDQNSVLVAINLSIHNGGSKPYWIHTIEASIETSSGNFSDEAAAAVDFDRYFQGFPTLKAHALPALKRETMLAPGADTQGTIIVSFPVSADAFAKRKSITVTVRPYDQPKSLIITK